jgi:Reverse transcriptase (RNA-dependent DNA polymerase)
MALISRYHSCQIDYVLAYTQAEIERLLYMEIANGFEVDVDPGYYVLECKKNIYGQKQAVLVWNKHLVARLKQVGFTQCEADPCIFI